MPTTKIEGGYNARYRYSAFDKTTDIEVYVESDEDIKAYVLSRDALKDFDAGDEFEWFSAGTVRGSRTLKCRVPRNVRWVLLLVNRGKETAAVHWEVVA